MNEGNKKSRRNGSNRSAGPLSQSVKEMKGDVDPDPTLDEKYPDTQNWTEEQKERYLA